MHIISPDKLLERNNSSKEFSFAGSGSFKNSIKLPNYSPFLNEAIQGIP